MKNLKLSLIVILSVAIFVKLAVGYTIRWFPNSPSDSVTSYKIYEVIHGSPDTYNLLATTGPSPSPTGSPMKYSHTLPLPTPAGTPKFVVMTAINAGGESLKSVEVTVTATPTPTPTATPTPALPTAPTGLEVLP